MTFNSLIFIFIALPLFFAIYVNVPIKKRSVAIFALSFVFYFWIEPKYAVGLLGLSFFVFILSKQMAKSENKQKKLLLIEIVSVVVFLLAYFKYYGFILSTIESIAKTELTFKLFVAPTAISFIAFTLISYAVDVYREKEGADNFVKFGAYVFFFPKILMGPITRYEDFKNQGESPFNADQFIYGIKRFIVGLGKKVILADSFAMVFSQMSQLEQPTMFSAWLCAIAFTFQIYFDFSGYSDMAVGVGHMFGYRIMENFNYPYVSVNIRDFWKRWHISLSSWFKDYVYIPLGGSKCQLKRVVFNTFIVWFLTGLWHGSSWNFVVWGLYYFVLLMIERYVLSKKQWKTKPKVKILITFILVTIGWVFFSFTDFTDMVNQLKAMIGVNGICNREFFWYLKNNFVLFVAGAMGSTPFFSNLSKRLKGHRWNLAKKAILAIIFVISIACIIKSSFTPFLYVQF